MGVIVEVFDDLNQENPWIRVVFAAAPETYQWCKMSALEVVNKKKGDDFSLLSQNVASSGSL